MLKEKLILLFFLISSFVSAQSDTSQTHGTIKVGKPKKEKAHLRASMDFNKYDFSKVEGTFSKDMLYPPFPGVEGYTFPFNYTKYFIEKIKDKEIDLRGKAFDTVRIEVKILANGKIYLKDKTLSVYSKQEGGIERSRLQMYCLTFLKEIKTWEPAYVAIPTKEKFKNQTVIKPKITNITASGILSIVFSAAPFEE